MEKMVVESWYGKEEVTISREKYAADGTCAIQLWCDEGPYATLTVCLDLGPKTKAAKKEHENLGFVDTNNCPWAPAFIKKYGFGRPTIMSKSSGYCTYPLYRFDLEKIDQLSKE